MFIKDIQTTFFRRNRKYLKYFDELKMETYYSLFAIDIRLTEF